MTFLWIALGLIVVVNVVGALLPVRSTGEVAVHLAASPQAVWDALHDPDAHPMTGKMKRAVEERGERDGLPTWVEDMGHGERITVVTTASDAPRHMVRELESLAVPMSSRWEYRLEPDGEGTRVHVAGVTDIRSGDWKVPLFRFMMRVGGGVRRGLLIQLRMVADTLGVPCEPRG